MRLGVTLVQTQRCLLHPRTIPRQDRTSRPGVANFAEETQPPPRSASFRRILSKFAVSGRHSHSALRMRAASADRKRSRPSRLPSRSPAHAHARARIRGAARRGASNRLSTVCVPRAAASHRGARGPEVGQSRRQSGHVTGQLGSGAGLAIQVGNFTPGAESEFSRATLRSRRARLMPLLDSGILVR